VTIAERRVAQAETVADSAQPAEDAHVAPAADATATLAAPTLAAPTVAAADADAEPATPLPSHSTYSPIEISNE